MIQYQLGRSIAQILPFQVTKQIAEPKPQMWEPLSMPVMVVMEILPVDEQSCCAYYYDFTASSELPSRHYMLNATHIGKLY